MVALSGCQFWQADAGSIAQRCDGFQRHVSGVLGCPPIILLQQQGADEPDDGVVVGKDTDDIGAAFDLAIEPFERVGGVDFRPVLAGNIHVGEHVGFGLVEQSCELGQAGAHLVGDVTPLLVGRSGGVLGKGGADPGGDHTLLGFAGISRGITHEVHTGAVEKVHIGDVIVGKGQVNPPRARSKLKFGQNWQLPIFRTGSEAGLSPSGQRSASVVESVFWSELAIANFSHGLRSRLIPVRSTLRERGGIGILVRIGNCQFFPRAPKPAYPRQVNAPRAWWNRYFGQNWQLPIFPTGSEAGLPQPGQRSASVAEVE